MITPGTKLGHFEIVAAIGAGGMGEVYRARDTRLDRLVAIKVLPPFAREDPERRQRFEREARAVAALNHPNICTLHDVGHDGEIHFLVMELVEGETLAQRLERGPLPLDQALRFAIELSSALDRAHRQAIVHRDLKPGNVILTKSGAKLLDFGLAKLRPAAGTTETILPTQIADQTAQGMILGTLQYMSPEQLEGKEADARSDIFALGAVLFEMVTGRKAFEGKSQASLITSIMSSAPASIAAIQPLAPAALDRIVSTCLVKDPDERWQTASDLGRELRWIADGQRVTTTSAIPVQAPAVVRRRFNVLAWVALAVAVLAVAGAWAVYGGASRDVRTSYTGTQFAASEFAFDPRVSPNGTLVAFQVMVDGLAQIAVMQPESGDFNVLTRDRTRGAISSLSWSADGTRIYYGRIDGVPRGVLSIPAVGGEERPVLEDATCPQALPDGTLLVVKINEQRQYQIYRYSPDTRRLQPYGAVVSGDVLYTRILQPFRDGTEAVFYGRSSNQTEADQSLAWRVLNLATGVVRQLSTTALADGISVWPLAISADDRSVVTADRFGDALRLIEIPRAGGPARELMTLTDTVAGLDVAPNGDVYVDQMARSLEAVMLDADGSRPRTVMTYTGIAAGNYGRQATSLPDGRLVFVARRGGRNRLLVAKPGQNPVPFVQTDEETSGPTAPIGTQEVAFLLGSAQTLAIASATDGRIVRRLEHAHGAAIERITALPDGKTLFYAAAGKIWSIASSEDGKPQAVGDGDGVAVDPRGDLLIIQINEPNNVRFVRHSLTGGPEQSLSFPGVRPATTLLAGNAVGPSGVILKNANYSDSWAWALALLDPATGRSQRVLLPLLDVQTAGWTATGQITVLGARTSSTIWRWRPIVH